MRYILLSLSLLILFACGPAGQDPATVPAYYRHHPYDEQAGRYLLDSLSYPGLHPRNEETGEIEPTPVRDWTYTDQLGRTITNDSLLGKVYVADFFFTSCPTICPKVKQQMLDIAHTFDQEADFHLVSFTIDPKRDTVGRLYDYAERLGVDDHRRWHFLTGDKLFTYELDQDYMSIAEENPQAPGGFDHTGYIVLVDRQGYVRAYGSGLEPAEVQHLKEDIRLLLDQPQHR